MNALLEYRLWDRRDGDEARRMRQACGIAVRSEDGDLVVRGPERFHALIRLLAIVESWGHAMEAQERVCDVFRLRPDAGLDAVVGFDMPIDCLCEWW